MNSNAVLAAVLAFSFFVFITTKGELLDYLGTVGLGPKAGEWKSKTQTSSGGGGSSGSITDVASSFASTAGEVASVASEFATIFG